MERTPAPPPNAVRVAPAYSTTRAASLGILASFAAFSVAAFAKVVIAEPRFSGAVLFGVLTSSFVVLLVLQRRLVGWMGAVATITTLGWLPFLGLGVIFAPDAIVDTMKLPTDGLRLRTVVLLAGLAGTIPALALSMSLSKRKSANSRMTASEPASAVSI